MRTMDNQVLMVSAAAVAAAPLAKARALTGVPLAMVELAESRAQQQTQVAAVAVERAEPLLVLLGGQAIYSFHGGNN